MDQKKINRYVELLADNMALMGNYARFAGSSKKMLIVEGATDERFMQKLISDDVWCVTATDVFSNEDCMMMTSEQLSRNNKMIIIDVVYGLSVFPTLINPKGLDTWSIYGMIDMDFDRASAHTNTNKLFITDTHDLETLLLSTDEKVLSKLDKCTITDDDMHKAFFVSYQLGVLRSVIYDTCGRDFSLKPLAAGGVDIDYGSFLVECRVSVPKLMKYINMGRMNNLPSTKINQLIKKVQTSKAIKKRIDVNGLWKYSVKEFEQSSIDDFWNMVNGHDILALLRFFNDGAKKAYSNERGRSLNRDFEFDLIEKYDYDSIGCTTIYSNMKTETVVKTL